MGKQCFKQLHHFFSSDCAGVKLRVEGHSLALGRHCQGTERINLALLVAHRTVGSVSLWSPSAFEMGDKQKTAFIQENQVRPQPRSLFLYAASGSAATERSQLRRADRRVARVSGNSSPSSARAAKSHGDGSGHETGAELLWRCALESTTRSDTPRLVLLGAGLGRGVLSGPPRDTKGDQELTWRASLVARTAGRFAPSARRNSLPRLLFARLRLKTYLVSRTVWLAGGGTPSALLLLGVSCAQA